MTIPHHLRADIIIDKTENPDVLMVRDGKGNLGAVTLTQPCTLAELIRRIDNAVASMSAIAA